MLNKYYFSQYVLLPLRYYVRYLRVVLAFFTFYEAFICICNEITGTDNFSGSFKVVLIAEFLMILSVTDDLNSCTLPLKITT